MMSRLILILCLCFAWPAWAGDENPAEPGAEAANPCAEAANPCAEAANPCAEAANPCAEAANPCAPVTFSDDSEAELRALVAELIPVVEELRGLKFKEPVKVEFMSQEDFATRLADEMEKELNEDEFGPRLRFFEMIRLLPEGTDLWAVYEEVLVEQVAGFYDPETRTLYLVQSNGPFMDRIILVHEIGHALDDQYFDLNALIEEMSKEEDQAFARMATVEGTATLLMMQYMTSKAGDAEAMGEMEEMGEIESSKLESAPPYLQRTMLNAYLGGQWFISRGSLMAIVNPDQSSMDQALSDPPLSSEQVLHPEKYWDPAQRDDPVTVTLPDLSGLLGEGWEKVDGATLGELYIAIIVEALEGKENTPMNEAEQGMLMMTDPQALFAPTHPAAEGWGGDRFEIYTNGDKLVGLWVTVWDSNREAKEFAKALKKNNAPWATAARGNAVLVLVGDLPMDAKAAGKTAKGLLKQVEQGD